MSIVVGIAGLTSKFAQCLAQALQAHLNVAIKGFCRSPQKLPQKAVEDYNIQVIKGEIDDEAAVERFVQGTDIIVCCYFGDEDVMIQGQKILIDACIKHGVSRYMPSDFAVDYTKISTDDIFPKRSAIIIREYLLKTRLAGVHILVGGLVETFWSPFFQIYDSKIQTISYWGTGHEKWDLTTYETAAAYTAALIADEKASGVFRFRGDQKSVLELKQVYEKVYNSPLNLEHRGSLEELYAIVKANFNKDASDVMAWAPGCFAYWCTNGIAHLGDDLDNKKYPKIIPVDIEGFLRANRREDLATADQRLVF